MSSRRARRTWPGSVLRNHRPPWRRGGSASVRRWSRSRWDRTACWQSGPRARWCNVPAFRWRWWTPWAPEMRSWPRFSPGSATVACWAAPGQVGCARWRAPSWTRSSTMLRWPRRSPARGPAQTHPRRSSCGRHGRTPADVRRAWKTSGMDTTGFLAWIDAYESARRSPGTDGLHQIFAADAVYLTSPYAEPVVGLDAIAVMWEAEREGPDEAFTMSRGAVAVSGAVGVGRVEVAYGEPVRQHYRDLWVVRFDDAGLAAHFEEWRFWPEHGASPQGSEE